jgi:hypothetical protein
VVIVIVSPGWCSVLGPFGHHSCDGSLPQDAFAFMVACGASFFVAELHFVLVVVEGCLC